MKWSLKIARIAGIDVQVHWTFGILLFWLAAVNLASGKGATEAAWGIAFVLAIFGCVILHEFGHALIAKAFGIRTSDITLLPIGGVARLERMPEEPKQEFLIAIAGPAVNVAIAVLLTVIIWLSGGGILPQSTVTPSSFWSSLLMVNVLLVVFNLIPAFPMDGGRILRAILAEYMDYVRATEIAANIGQFIAIGFGILGLFFNWFLLFIALFVYVGASAEAQMVVTRAMLSGDGKAPGINPGDRKRRRRQAHRIDHA
jgi:Zn-dependent protease